MKKALKSMKWLMLISGILVVILGITMLFTPLSNLVALAIFIGISMLISGISEIVSFCGEEKGHRSVWMLVSGILSTLFGIWTMFGRGTEALVAFLPFIFAVWVMSSGITRIVGAVSLKSEGSSLWGWMLAFGILGTVFGFLLLFSPVLSGMMISYALAFMLISHGVNNIIIFFHMNKIGNHIREHLGE